MISINDIIMNRLIVMLKNKDIKRKRCWSIIESKFNSCIVGGYFGEYNNTLCRKGYVVNRGY